MSTYPVAQPPSVTYSGMKFSDIQTEVSTILRRPLAPDATLSATILSRLVNRSIRRIARLHDFRILEDKVFFFSSVAGNPYINLPDLYKEKPLLFEYNSNGVLKIIADTVLVGGNINVENYPFPNQPPSAFAYFVFPNKSGEQKVNPAYIYSHYPNPNEQGEPALYCVAGENILLAPVPDQVYNYVFYCTAYPPDLVNSTDTNWFTRNLESAVINEAVGLGLQDRGEDEEAEDYFERAELEIREQLNTESTEKIRRTGPRAAVLAAGYQ